MIRMENPLSGLVIGFQRIVAESLVRSVYEQDSAAELSAWEVWITTWIQADGAVLTGIPMILMIPQ